jgi:hypothetical protein
MADRDNSPKNVMSRGQPDDVRTAPEEGDPTVSGRSRGHLIEESGAPAGKKGAPDARGIGSGAGKHTSAGPAGNSGKTGEDMESGRQGTT